MIRLKLSICRMPMTPSYWPGLAQEATTIDVDDCGTAFRFLTVYLATKEGEFILTGSQQMKQRPIEQLVDALYQLGAEIHYLEKKGFPPLKISGKLLRGGRVDIDASVVVNLFLHCC